jgi:hypothetical protein
MIIENGCSDTSDCVSAEVSGNNINELEEGNMVHLYPNPTDGRVTIRTQQLLADATVRLVSAVGQSLAAYTGLQGTTFVLDMAPYADGVYFVEIGERGRTVRLKIVKQ